MADTLIVEKKYAGPPGIGNGGYVAGLLAREVRGPAQITLLRPTPLDTPLRLEHEADGVVNAVRDGQTLASAKPAALDLQPPHNPGAEAARAAAGMSPALTRNVHPICFVCGTERDDNEGLNIYAGPVDDAGTVAACWTPADNLANSSGCVDPVYIWSALDCPGAFAFMATHQPGFLGRITGEVTGQLRANEPAVVVGWKIGAEGRKLHAGTAVFNAAGQVVGLAKAVWFGPA